MELTNKHKRLVLNYVLYLNKGLFEDVPEFFEGVEEEQWEELMDASYDYVDFIRERLFGELNGTSEETQ
jgi:hypothetical protein